MSAVYFRITQLRVFVWSSCVVFRGMSVFSKGFKMVSVNLAHIIAYH